MSQPKKEKFLDCFEQECGIIAPACEKAGVTRRTYYRWLKEDPEFASEVEAIKETQIDFVESKLIELINAGDTTATIYYLKTQGRKRGWNEKYVPQEPKPKKEEAVDAKLNVRIETVATSIIAALKNAGIYTEELTMQINLAAQLVVRTELLSEEIFRSDHQAVLTEISREGNPREVISDKERLYLEYSEKSQRALRALGMNRDSKMPKEVDTDNGLEELIKSMQDD